MTREGIPKGSDLRFDAPIHRFAKEECFGDTLGDYLDGTHGGGVASAVGEVFGCGAGASDAGLGVGFGWPAAVGGGGANGMDRQTLRDWVHRYNEAGIEGLKSRKSPGRKAFLTPARMAALREFVVEGPDPATHGVVRWRCVDLAAEVARRWQVEVHESTIGKWLNELGLRRLQPRLVNPRKDAAAETAFKKTSPLWRAPRLPR